MRWVDLIHPSFRFPYGGSRGRIEQGEAHSLLCSLGEFEREHEDEVGSYGRGQLGHFYSWRSYGSLDPYYFVLITLAWRRAHYRRRAHNTPSGPDLDLADCRLVCFIGEVAHKSTLSCNGFFFGATKVKGASLE